MSWLFPSRVEPMRVQSVEPPTQPYLVAWAEALRNKAEDEYCLACDAYRALTVVLAQ